MNFQMFKLDLEMAEEPEIKLPISTGSMKKQASSRTISTSDLLTMPKPLIVWTTTNYGKFLRALTVLLSKGWVFSPRSIAGALQCWLRHSTQSPSIDWKEVLPCLAVNNTRPTGSGQEANSTDSRPHLSSQFVLTKPASYGSRARKLPWRLRR